MKKSLLIRFLGENPAFRIVDFLIENKGIDVTKKQIIEETGISRLLYSRSGPSSNSKR